jgi:hypothetical protein
VKNFPHQVNKLERFAGGLGVFQELIEAESDVTDDGIVGDALARAGVYTFRDEYDPANIEELLEEEHAKPASNQGTRTMARELRRTFSLLGLLRVGSDGLELSGEARALITFEHEPLSQEARAIWRAAFRDLELVDESGTSHPYEVMLRLAGERPGVSTALLGLALEATNDSEEEFARLLDLVDLDIDEPAWDRLGISVHQRRNSVKILPAVARQLGDIEVVDNCGYLRLQDPTAPRAEHGRRQRRSVRSRRRHYDRARNRGQRPSVTESTVRTYDPDLLAARYAAHEETLSAFDALIPDGYARWEGDYDLLVVKEADLLLVEVKTIRLDAHTQVRAALAQLLYYEHFDIRPEWSDATIHRLLVLDSPIDDELVNFLGGHDIGVLWQLLAGTWEATPRARAQLSNFGVTV